MTLPARTASRRASPGADDAAINPTGMWSQAELVTVATAVAYLATMPEDQQRSLRPKRVQGLARDMAAGLFVLHHQGIAFDTRGRLRDGQHRLQAVVSSGTPAVLWVTYNVPEEALLHVDEQLPRSIADAIRMAGRGDFSCSEVSTARVILTYPRREMTGVTVSKDVIIRRLKLWAEDIDFAESRLAGKGLTRGVRALVARAHAHLGVEAQDRLSQWCEVLRTGKPVSQDHREDGAAISYRNCLLERSGTTINMEVEKYRKGQTTLENFLARRDQGKVYGTERDLYPVPEGRSEDQSQDRPE